MLLISSMLWGELKHCLWPLHVNRGHTDVLFYAQACTTAHGLTDFKQCMKANRKVTIELTEAFAFPSCG